MDIANWSWARTEGQWFYCFYDLEEPMPRFGITASETNHFQTLPLTLSFVKLCPGHALRCIILNTTSSWTTAIHTTHNLVWITWCTRIRWQTGILYHQAVILGVFAVNSLHWWAWISLRLRALHENTAYTFGVHSYFRSFARPRDTDERHALQGPI